ncbi:MAG: hypothetical protein HYT11_04225 [Candidatus Levybacteria bacterium]|nr:hypothetical protein [Candidatus Levybacteria bacterium]
MGDFNRYSRSGERRDFGRRRFDRRGSDRQQMHKATCSRCGKACEVPFMPTGSKPVFCNDCFRDKGASGAGSYGGRDSGRPNFDERRTYEKERFEALHAKLDKIINMLTPVAATETVQEEKIAKEIKYSEPDKQINKIIKKKTAAKKATSTKT